MQHVRAPFLRSKMHGEDSLDPQPGMRIDDFTVAYRITRGMNADVFAVWHHGLGAPLICKRLRPPDVDNRKWRRLLVAEGAVLAGLNHPGIVRLIEQNRRALLPYMLLEHTGTRTLRDELLAHKRLPVDAAVRIVQHTSAAVAYLHERGFLHRDIKPSNIILRNGRPVLLDFGIVWRLKGAKRPPDRSGTPQRLAPEQIRREPLLPAADVFGLGTLLFELLTGERPFPASAHAHDHAAPFGLRYPQLTRPPYTLAACGCLVPDELQTVISRALAPHLEDRFVTVRELLTALDSFTHIKIYPENLLTTNRAFEAKQEGSN
jgi:serine/threonine-protein kinase